MTIVPPENSTPLGIPFVQITTSPAMMISHESAIACQRHLTKLKFGLWKICIGLVPCNRRETVASDTERGLLARREFPFVDRLRHEVRREEVHQQPDRQRRREAANRPGA